MPDLKAAFITPAASRWLQTTHAARILNLFEHACNLVNQDDDVLAVVTSERGLTPFGLVIAESSPFQSLVVNSPVSVNGDRLSIGDLAIDTHLASPWSPIPDWDSLRGLFDTEPDRLNEFTRLTLDVALDFRGSLLDIFFPFRRFDPDKDLAFPPIWRVLKAATDLADGLNQSEEEKYLNGVRLLAGAGAGLTPAGDDFIAGTLLAIWAGLYGAGRESLAQTIAETTASLTTTLSAAYLRAAARGECIIHWHHLFTALQSSDTEEIRAAVKALLAIGHTSGADGLAGFINAWIFNDRSKI